MIQRWSIDYYDIFGEPECLKNQLRTMSGLEGNRRLPASEGISFCLRIPD